MTNEEDCCVDIQEIVITDPDAVVRIWNGINGVDVFID